MMSSLTIIIEKKEKKKEGHKNWKAQGWKKWGLIPLKKKKKSWVWSLSSFSKGDTNFNNDAFVLQTLLHWMHASKPTLTRKINF